MRRFSEKLNISGGILLDVYIGRLPVFDASGNIFAYTLPYRSEENASFEYVAPDSEETNKLFEYDVRRLVGKSRAFIYFSDEMLRARLPLIFSHDILIVCVHAKQLEDAGIMNICRDLKERGYMLALVDFEYSKAYDEIFGLVDIVEIDFKKASKSIEETAYVCRYANKLMLAVSIETREEYEDAKRLGCTFMRGFYFAKPDIDVEKGFEPLPVSIANAMQILSRKDAEIEEVVKALSVDSAVCQRLLRLINSVYFGFTQKIASINQAIVVLGLDYLREWIYLMAVQKLLKNDSPEATKTSLLMAKLCRKIALMIPEGAKNPESFYLMGLLSMVVFGGESVLTKALDEFPITFDIKKGLMRKGGLYSDVFEMAFGFLRADWEKFEEIASIYNIGIGKMTSDFVECAEEVEQAQMN